MEEQQNQVTVEGQEMEEQQNQVTVEGQEMEQQQNQVTVESLEEVPKTLYHAIKGNNSHAVQKLIEEGEDVNVRGMDGQTLLHLAVSVKAEPKIFTALLEKVDDFGVSQRDENGDSVLEIILQNDYAQEAEDSLKERVKQIILKEDESRIKSLVASGWTMFSCFDNLKESEELEDKKEFLEKLSIFKGKVETVHKGIEEGDVAVLEVIREDQQLCIACDRTGLPPLTKAVILAKSELVRQITKHFPDSVNVKDNLGRVALHYAAVSADEGEIYQVLLDAGAEDIQDKEGKTASDYKEDQDLLDLSKVHQRIQNILNKSQITERVKVQQETEGHSEVPENQEGQDEVVNDGEKEAEQLTSNEENQSKEPVETFKEIPSKEIKSEPTSYEGQYLASTLGQALTQALAEIAECRPWDPIEYLAHYLYKFHADKAFLQHQKDLEKEIKEEEDDREVQRLEQEKRREEERQIKEDDIRRQKEEAEEEERQRLEIELEEQQRKSKEASLAHPPDLPTVKEEENGEVDSVVREKDENGQTELHKLAGQEGADLMALLNAGYSLADRDSKYRTPRDIAEENGLEDNVEVFDSYLADMIEGEKLEDLQHLMLDGYDKFSSVLEKVSTDGLPENVTTFISAIPDFQGKIKDMIKAVRSGEKRHVSQTLTRKSFALAKDNMGRSPLHNAVLYNHREVTEYITTFPSSLTARDTLNRTPVHYAAGLSDDLFDLLVQNGGSLITKDARGKTPVYYKANNEEITALREEAPGIEVTAPDNGEEEGNTETNDEQNEADKDENSENNEATKESEQVQS